VSHARVDRFIAALRALEEDRNCEPLLALFARDATAGNPFFDPPLHGREGIRRFWIGYRATFDRVRSTFERRIVEGDQAALEWRTEGEIAATRRPVTYRGVTLLQFAGEQVIRLRAYYDPRPFLPARGRPIEALAVAPPPVEILGEPVPAAGDREHHYQVGPYGTTAGPPD